jgi:hypothetical protein
METSAGPSTSPASGDESATEARAPGATEDPAADVQVQEDASGQADAAASAGTPPSHESSRPDARPFPGGRRGRRAVRRAGRASRPISARKAVALLAGMLVVAVALAGTTAFLAIRGFAAAGNRPGATAPLIVPAPVRAANLPRHYKLTTDQSALLAIAQFMRRFGVQSGRPPGTYAVALYGEPGRVDLTTGASGWIMYVGYNAPANLGSPAATITRLMTNLAGPSPTASWQVPAGSPGGSARCMVTVVGPTKMSVCGWATDRTEAAFMSPLRDTSVTGLAALMQVMRINLQPG